MVAGVMGSETCSPSRPVPILHFHGTDDRFVPYAGGVGRRSKSETIFYSVEHTVRKWVKANRARNRPLITLLPERVADGTHVTRTRYPAGHGSAEFVLYTIEGAGHTWPGRQPEFDFLGVSTRNLVASDVISEFFQQHLPPQSS